MIIPGYYLLNLKLSFNISFFFLCTFFFFASEFFLFKGHICLLPCSVLIYFSNLSRYGVSSKIYFRSHRHHPSSHRIAHASACMHRIIMMLYTLRPSLISSFISRISGFLIFYSSFNILSACFGGTLKFIITFVLNANFYHNFVTFTINYIKNKSNLVQ